MVFTKASRAQIRDADPSFMSKLVIRMILTLFCFVAIGCIAAVTAIFPGAVNDFGWSWALLVPLVVSVIWTFITTLYLILRKKPVHPGFNVGADLVLSIGYVLAGIFGSAEAVLAVSDSNNGTVGQDYGYNQPSYYPNGTYYYPKCPGYASCAQQAAINHKAHGIATTYLVGAVFFDLVFFLHFILFIWACVDTHRYNKNNNTNSRAREIASEIIMQMRERGELPPAREPLLASTLSNQRGSSVPIGMATTGDPVMSGAATPYQESHSPHLMPQNTAYEPPHMTAYQPVHTSDYGEGSSHDSGVHRV